MSPILNVNPASFVSPYRYFGGEYRFTVLQLMSLTKWFSIQFQSSMTTIYHKLLRREGRVLTNGWLPIIHDNICSLIYKKCHLKSYHSDIKYLRTLKITFSVLHAMLGTLTLLMNLYIQPTTVHIRPRFMHLANSSTHTSKGYACRADTHTNPMIGKNRQ